MRHVEEHIRRNDPLEDHRALIANEPIAIKFGLNLLGELIRVFKYNLEGSIDNEMIRSAIKEELYSIIHSQIETDVLWTQAKNGEFQ